MKTHVDHYHLGFYSWACSKQIISNMTPFDFNKLASDIYSERTGAHSEPFLLPACYGGEAPDIYEAMFVLEEPSRSFTERRWCTCTTVEEAIQMHREIFVKWAYRGKPAILFNAVDQFVQSGDVVHEGNAGFFRRYYVTDIWKDSAFKERINDQSYKDYWLSKLAVELRNVSTRRIIFVGREASKGRQFVPATVPVYEVPFPSHRRADEAYADDVRQLIEKMYGKVGRAITSPG